MKTNDQTVVFSSENPNWGTPAELFEPLAREFPVALDAAGSPGWHKTLRFLGPGSDLATDALKADWRDFTNRHEAIFLNPPFSRALKMPIEPWLKACAEFGADRTIVAIVPARVDTTWWNAHIAHSAAEIRFIPHRVKFVPPPGHQKKGFSAGFPTSVVIWRPQPGIVGKPGPRVVSWTYRRA